MADRIARPPARLRGGLPDGTLTGLPASLVKDLLGSDPEPFYALVKLGRRQLIHDDETDGDVAVLGVLALETLPDDALLPEENPAAALAALRSERIGDNPIDFDSASDHDYEKLEELRATLAEYQAERGMSDLTLGEDIIDTVPGAEAGWRDDARIIGEYLRVKGALPDPVVGEDEGDGRGPEADDDPVPDDDADELAQRRAAASGTDDDADAEPSL